MEAGEGVCIQEPRTHHEHFEIVQIPQFGRLQSHDAFDDDDGGAVEVLLLGHTFCALDLVLRVRPKHSGSCWGKNTCDGARTSRPGSVHQPN